MEILLIPIQNIPDQEFVVDLNGKECSMRIYLRYNYMYLDLTVDDKVLFKGQICLNNVDLIQYNHMDFDGNLRFIDTQGNEDPYYTGFGERWYLAYVQ